MTVLLSRSLNLLQIKFQLTLR